MIFLFQFFFNFQAPFKNWSTLKPRLIDQSASRIRALICTGILETRIVNSRRNVPKRQIGFFKVLERVIWTVYGFRPTARLPGDNRGFTVTQREIKMNKNTTNTNLQGD